MLPVFAIFYLALMNLLKCRSRIVLLLCSRYVGVRSCDQILKLSHHKILYSA